MAQRGLKTTPFGHLKPPALKLPAGRAPAEEEVMRKAKRNAKSKPFLLPSFVLLFGRRKATPKENAGRFAREVPEGARLRSSKTAPKSLEVML